MPVLRRACVIIVIASLATPAVVASAKGAKVDFTRDVRPILAQNCFACHGNDEGNREAGLRLDVREAAVMQVDSGETAVVPGHPGDSELIKRITTDDADVRMPPASSGHTLTPEQIETLTTWIAEGAEYSQHWSFRPLSSSKTPEVANDQWCRSPIDRFVLARLEREKITPSPEADATTLIRRLSLDLIGLPPTAEEAASFVKASSAADASEEAYEALVDRLLASPHFGERWGRHWLDLARYADSDGYLGDNLRRYAWLYRDWVIDAINRDVPYDQFTVEQLAGDLLSSASVESKTATGFLRNSLRNTEAGVDKEEYRVKEVVDRVSTIGTVWLGLTVGCAECHSHKYDPISHREFYQLFAFFNNADDVDVAAPRPGEMEQYRDQRDVWQQRQDELVTAMEAALRPGENIASPADRVKLLAALAVKESKRTTEQKTVIKQAVEGADESLRQLCTDYESHAVKKPDPPDTKTMAIAGRKKDRESFVHLRGDYRSRGESVSPGTLSVLPALSAQSEKPNRLDFAHWLVDENNPLTPRVTANQVWRHLFGRGLVSTVENFGAAGESPSHPELLDWLANELIQKKWSRKQFIKTIVMSATYRQSSNVRKELVRRDPQNVLLARQGRFRMEAELVRDAALASSGLLSRAIGGPSIRPPQAAYVTSISRNSDWKVSTGSEKYRRGMYILFRRATPYPMLLTFDAPDSTTSCTRRERSNSPLQALTLLNDPVFFECAQALGARLAKQKGDDKRRLTTAFLRCLGREPTDAERERLMTFYRAQQKQFAKSPTTASEITGAATNENAPELAAWTTVARVLMNLDEFITRE